MEGRREGQTHSQITSVWEAARGKRGEHEENGGGGTETPKPLARHSRVSEACGSGRQGHQENSSWVGVTPGCTGAAGWLHLGSRGIS